MRKHLYALSICLLLLSAYALAVFAHSYKNFLITPLIPADKTLIYTLKSRTTIRALAKDLQCLGLLKQPNYFISLAYLRGMVSHLQPGEYLFNAGSTPNQLLSQLTTSKTTYQRFVLYGGTNFQQLLTLLSNTKALSHQLTAGDDSLALSKLGFPLNQPEGMFLPTTYRYVKGTSDVAILQKAHQLMTDLLQQEWQQRAPNLPYQNVYQALTVASLIEKETTQAAERPLVAGVILKRLQKNMRLQIDSSVIYGLGSNYTGKLQRADLKTDTPYNTYKRKGLPPTPIAMPSRQAIHAALHPIDNGSLYFVYKSNGTHLFSPTLTAQTKAVKFYQVDMHFPKVGKRLNNKKQVFVWYLSPRLRKLIS